MADFENYISQLEAQLSELKKSHEGIMLQVSKNTSRCCKESSKSHVKLQEVDNKSVEDNERQGVQHFTKLAIGTFEHKQGKERPPKLLEDTTKQCPSGNSKHRLHETHDMVDKRNLDAKDGEGSQLETHGIESHDPERYAILLSAQFQSHGCSESDKREVDNALTQEKIAN